MRSNREKFNIAITLDLLNSSRGEIFGLAKDWHDSSSLRGWKYQALFQETSLGLNGPFQVQYSRHGQYCFFFIFKSFPKFLVAQKCIKKDLEIYFFYLLKKGIVIIRSIF